MRYIHYTLSLVFSFCLIITLLITSVEAVTYWMPGYYENEYKKYNVTADVHMEMKDLLEVTDEMMAYLRGNREDLHVPTVVNGQPREFFNEREIAHMEDVRELFLGGLMIRRICIATAIICLLLFDCFKITNQKDSSYGNLCGHRIIFCLNLWFGSIDIYRFYQIFCDIPSDIL